MVDSRIFITVGTLVVFFVLEGAFPHYKGRRARVRHALPESWDKALRAITVTPNMHRIHHSVEYEEGNSNFSTVFSFWDRLAKTFKIKSGTENMKLGVKGIPEHVQKDIKKMILLPWDDRVRS